MRLGSRVLVLVLCVAALVAGGAAQAIQGQDAAKLDSEARLAIKIGPTLGVLLGMEKAHFPAPPDGTLGQTIANMRQTGRIYAYIRAAHELADAEMRAVEALGVALSARSSPIPHRGKSYGASIPLDKIYDVARFPFVGLIDLRWSPWTEWTLDDSVPELRGDLGWLLKDGQGRRLTGQGIRIAAFDTGVDILHPDFWFADGATYDWRDHNGNGVFDPGTDYVDLNGNGQRDIGEILRYLQALGAEGDTPGVFDTDIEWLYIDADNDGIRDNILQEGVPTYGEPILVVTDTDRDRRLGLGEKITALNTSKVYKTYRKPNPGSSVEERTRGVDLINTWPDTDGHGTATGDITVGYLSVTAIGNPWDVSLLDITITTLSDVMGDDMPASDIDGFVLITW